MSTKSTTGAGAAVPNNNSGVMINAGDGTGDFYTQELRIMDVAKDLGDTNRLVESSGNLSETSDRAGLAKIDAAYSLGYQSENGDGRDDFIIRGVTRSIGGVSNNILRSPGSTFPTNEGLGTVRTTVTTNRIGSHATTKFDILARPSTNINPNRTRGDNAGVTSTMINPADGTDAVPSEIDGSRTVPGELTFRTGAVLPITYNFNQ